MFQRVIYYSWEEVFVHSTTYVCCYVYHATLMCLWSESPIHIFYVIIRRHESQFFTPQIIVLDLWLFHQHHGTPSLYSSWFHLFSFASTTTIFLSDTLRLPFYHFYPRCTLRLVCQKRLQIQTWELCFNCLRFFNCNMLVTALPPLLLIVKQYLSWVSTRPKSPVSQLTALICTDALTREVPVPDLSTGFSASNVLEPSGTRVIPQVIWHLLQVMCMPKEMYISRTCMFIYFLRKAALRPLNTGEFSRQNTTMLVVHSKRILGTW